MDYAMFVRLAERGEAPPITLLHGGDVQLLDDALAAATRGLFPDSTLAAWGREVFDGRERSVDDLVRSAMTLPFGSGRRLVAVRRAQALPAKATDTLLGETRKAALAGGPDNRAVGVKDVGAVVGEHRLDAIFDLTRAVERRDIAGALKTLDRLLATEDAMLLLSVLARDVRTAWTAVAWRRRGRAVEEIARALRRPPAVIEALTGSTSGSETLFAWKLRRCWDVERRLKNSGEPRAEMATLVADLCAER